MSMDRLRALEAFVRTAELGSFSAAARELRVTQSAVSKWIARLEHELDVTLLQRTTRASRLTDAGREFVEHAASIVAAWEAARASVVPGALAGRLRVSLPVVFGTRHVLPMLDGFLTAHPDVELDLRLDDRYVNLVTEGVDVAVRVGLQADSSMRVRTLLRTPRRLVASPAYLERRGRPRDPGALAEHDALVHSGPGTAIWRFAEPPRRVEVRPRASANHSEVLRQLAVDGHGIALLASWLVDDDVAAGTLVALMAEQALPPAPIQVVFPHARRAAPTEAFVAALDAHLSQTLAVLP